MRVYLDYNATSPVDREVVEAMQPYFEKEFGNPSSLHRFGQRAREAVEEARCKIATFIRAENPEEIIFTSGGTESNNLAIKGVAYANQERGKHIITSSVEHHAVLNPCRDLEKKGWRITYLGVDKYGVVNLEELEKAIEKDTVLVSIMHANNEVGTIQPVSEISKIIKKINPEIYLHTDAVQSAGKIEVDVEKMGVDLLSISAHKLYGPKGIGALYIRKGVKIEPQISGGHHERNLRAGTENVPAIVGFAKAAEIVEKNREEETVRLKKLSELLYTGILKEIENVYLNGHPVNRLPNTLNLSFEFVEGEAIVLNLDLKGIAVSSGSACTSGALEPSHVLSAMGIDLILAKGAVRFSLGKDNTEEEIKYVIDVLKDVIPRLRSISPLYKKKI